MAGRCLIVANQTLGGSALERAVKDCIHRDVRTFYVVVPRTHAAHEQPAWRGGFDLTLREANSAEAARRAWEERARKQEQERDEASRRAQRRLELMLEKVRSEGGQAEGEVGVEDPLEATSLVLARRAPFDEIIVSTLPARLSRWLRMDLPNRIARLSDVPVTTVEAEDIDERKPA